jgi:hypothetical protein
MELTGTSPADIASTGYRATTKPSRSKPRFFVAIAILMTVIVAVGFWPSYYGPLLRGVAVRPLVIHVHGIVFIGWMALLLTQVALVATGRTAAHRKVGTAGIVYGFLVIAMGLVVGFAAPILHLADHEWDMDRAAGFLLIILGDMALFGGFFIAAMIYRRKPELHKRLILLATVALLFAAVGRMAFIPSPLISLVVWLAPVFIGIAYDALTQRRVHHVYIVGTIVLFIGACRLFFIQSEAWLRIGRSLLRIFIA